MNVPKSKKISEVGENLPEESEKGGLKTHGDNSTAMSFVRKQLVDILKSHLSNCKTDEKDYDKTCSLIEDDNNEKVDESGDKDEVSQLSISSIARSLGKEGVTRRILGDECEIKIIEKIGEGGQAEVYRVRDPRLGRDVAMKIILPDYKYEPSIVKMLLDEARFLASLQHRGILSIHNIGETDDGRPYIEMDLITGVSLKDILERIKGEASIAGERTKLLNFFMQACMTIHFVHSKNVIHRDLKPANIMIDEGKGETLVIDFGLLVKQGKESTEGDAMGTAAYMSPEQARKEELDKRSDIYSLGVVLYQILTGEKPFKGENMDDFREKIGKLKKEDIIRPSIAIPTREDIPFELEEIVLKAMDPNPDERYQTAKRIHDDIQSYFEGTKEREREHREAERMVDEGEGMLEKCNFLKKTLEDTIVSQRKSIEEFDSTKFKTGREQSIARSKLSERDEEITELEDQILDFFLAAQRKFEQARDTQKTNKRANKALELLYFEEYVKAQEAGNKAKMTSNLERALKYEGKERGEDTELDILGHGGVEVLVEPKNADVKLYVFEEVKDNLGRKFLQKKEVTNEYGCNNTNGIVSFFTIPRGSYIISLQKPEYGETFYPFLIKRGQKASISLSLLKEDQRPEGFIHIPGGNFTPRNKVTKFQSDHSEVNEAEEVYVGDFLISKYPVTVGQYLEFLNDLYKQGDQEVLERLPTTKDIKYMELTQSGCVLVPDAERIEYPLNWPVVNVSFNDADAFCREKTRSDKKKYEWGMPTLEQWQMAASGADGRKFPWGDHFDEQFCKMDSSDPEKEASNPAPIGSFPQDESPYGVRGLGGGVSDWLITKSPEGFNLIAGGNWKQSGVKCKIYNLKMGQEKQRFSTLSFRPIIRLPHMNSRIEYKKLEGNAVP